MTYTPSTVRRATSRYQGIDAWTVDNPSGDRFHPGRTVTVCPAHEEAPGWRAILAGYAADGAAYVVPLAGHFGELSLRKLSPGAGGGGLCLSKDAPSEGGRYSRGDEVDWTAAKVLALSTAHAFGLHGQA